MHLAIQTDKKHRERRQERTPIATTHNIPSDAGTKPEVSAPRPSEEPMQLDSTHLS